MPPSDVHFNGSVNMPDTETVFRELAERVGDMAHAYPDGEPGERQNWIIFQVHRFLGANGLVAGEPRRFTRTNEELPQVKVADDVNADDVDFGDLGYAEAYTKSYEIFRRLRDEGVIAEGVRFQVQYPTPTAPVVFLVRPEDHQRLYAAYERAIMEDLKRFLESVAHEDVAVQWDVCAEFGIIEDADWFKLGPLRDRKPLAARLAGCINAVPNDVPVGLHLCYGDYKHGHESEPESLRTQVDLLNEAIAAGTERSIDWVSLTVPHYRDDDAYFEPLKDLQSDSVGRLYLGIVPYWPEKQLDGTTDRQVECIDRYIAEWGVCTECGMARHHREGVPDLLDLHRSIVEGHRASI